MAKAHEVGVLLTVLVILAMSAEVAHGICNLSSDGIRACQPAAAISNPTDKPSAECCAALAGADLPCLCRYKNAAGVWVRFYRIDINRAMALPGKCGLAPTRPFLLKKVPSFSPERSGLRRRFVSVGGGSSGECLRQPPRGFSGGDSPSLPSASPFRLPTPSSADRSESRQRGRGCSGASPGRVSRGGGGGGGGGGGVFADSPRAHTGS